MNKYFRLLIFFCAMLVDNCATPDQKPDCLSIDFWYGEKQSFGYPGLAQRWINVLGNVASDHGIRALYYDLNEQDSTQISWGQDQYRLAHKGDFNMDIHFTRLKEGDNSLRLTAIDSAGHLMSRVIHVKYITNQTWPLPYTIDWSVVNHIQEAVQVVDGNWKLTENGIRTNDPWYDRILAIGDSTWTDYEIETSVIFHGYTPPVAGPPNYGVSHAALAMRWPGHDADENQPHVKWYPLGATCEFQLMENLDSCRWRILGGRNLRTEDTYQHFPVHLGEEYYFKSRVEEIGNKITRYRVKIWKTGTEEPGNWQLSAIEGAGDIQSGSALLIAHNTDVTFGNISIHPVE